MTMTAPSPGYVQSRVYMDTMVTIQVPDEQVPGLAERIERAFGWFQAVEQRCSRFDLDSELSRLCGQVGTPVEVSPLLYRAIEFAMAVAEASDGAFDPTIGGAMERRGFNRNYRTGAVTQGISVSSATYRDVELDQERRTVMLMRPLRLDLGAVAKGLAVDLAASELDGIESLLINAGGDVYVRGFSPERKPWRVGVKDPSQPDRLLAALPLTAGAVCTSGGYERPATAHNGHHIISPESGESPAGIASVTVVAPSAMVADALSTAVFVLGCEAGLAFAEAQGVDALIVDQHGRLFATDGMKGYL